MTYIIDAHEDIAYNALAFARDFHLSVHEIRAREKKDPNIAAATGEATLGWDEYQRGKIAVIFASLFLTPQKYISTPFETQSFSSPAQAKPLLHRQLDYYSKLTEGGESFRLIQNKADLAEVITPWEEGKPGSHPVGLVLLLEGAECLEDLHDLEEYYERGLRIVGPVWSGMRFMGGTREDRPLDEEGRRLLDEMAALNLIMDISHMREHSALTTLDRYEGPIIAGHANSRVVNGGQGGERHLTDATIRRLIERGGVMGILPYNRFLISEWKPSLPRESVTLEAVVRHIDHVCQLSGDSKHVAIGSDFDGGFGFPDIPLEMDSIADLQKLAPLLTQQGYTEEDIRNIFHQNWLHLLERSLPL